MSQFSGKCDLYDDVVMIGKYNLDQIELFIDKNNKTYPIKLTEPRDLILYYPYVPYASSYHDGKFRAWLSESYIDVEERNFLKNDLNYLKRLYRRAKRKGEKFQINETDKRWFNEALIKRVETLGEKATIDGIHLATSNHYRKRLAEEMEKNGYEDIDIIKWIYTDKWLTSLSTGFDWRKDIY